MKIYYGPYCVIFGTFIFIIWSATDETRYVNDELPYKVVFSRQTLPEESTMSPTALYRSSLYNVSSSSLGIMRVVHMTKKTRQSSSWTASGKGLLKAYVGELASLTVHIDNHSLAEFNKETYISVLVVGRNHLFVANPSRQSKTAEGIDVNFTYVPTMAGAYYLYIEEISQVTQKQIPGSPFRLKVEGPSISHASKRMESNRKPSCQTIPQKNYSWLDGDWVSRELAGDRGALRSGWVFQPKLCRFDIFDDKDLAIAATSHFPTTIAILGTSTERGVFLTLIDLALRSNEKVGLSTSDVGKCWGYAQVSLGNLTFIYQDLRLFSIAGRNQMTCHNEKLASTNLKSLEADAMNFMREFLFKDPTSYPSIILITVKNAQQLCLMVDQIPEDWKGTIYPINNFRSKFGTFYTVDGRKKNAHEVEKFASVDPRVETLDGFGLSSGMRHATESSPFIMKSNHFHRWCNELNGEMTVCGNPTEMVAQLLLGKALAPNGKRQWKIAASRDIETQSISDLVTREIKICFDCPASLLPFHLKVNPKLECYKVASTGFKARNKSNVHVWDGSMCPDYCMKTKPVEKLYTQTDTVDVRICE